MREQPDSSSMDAERIRLRLRAAVFHAQSGGTGDRAALEQSGQVLDNRREDAEVLYREHRTDPLSEGLTHDLAGYYHQLGESLHLLGQITVPDANRCFTEASELRAELEQTMALGRKHMEANRGDLATKEQRHNALIREGNAHADAMRRYDRKSDAALHRALELDPLDLQAKRLIEFHDTQYGES